MRHRSSVAFDRNLFGAYVQVWAIFRPWSRVTVQPTISDGQRALDRQPKVGEGLSNALHGETGILGAPERRRRLVHLADVALVQQGGAALDVVIVPRVEGFLHDSERRALAGAAQLPGADRRRRGRAGVVRVSDPADRDALVEDAIADLDDVGLSRVLDHVPLQQHGAERPPTPGPANLRPLNGGTSP